MYRAKSLGEAEVALDDLETLWGEKYPIVIKSWRSKWERLSAYFKYPEDIRRIIYTTNSIEALLMAALGGGVGYGVTAWLAPDDISAGVVAVTVAALAFLIELAPGAFIGAGASNPWRPPKSSRFLGADEVRMGLSMIGGMGGFDAAGNTFGMNCDDD